MPSDIDGCLVVVEYRALPSSGRFNWVYVAAEVIRMRKYVDYIGKLQGLS